MPVLGLREFQDALLKVEAGADQASRSAVARMSSLVEDAVKGNFQGSHAKGDPHVGTSPPRPNVVSGYLRRSVRSDPISRSGIATYGTRVGPRAAYARAVELGRTASSAKYPYFVPGANAARPKFPEITAQEWRKFVRP